MSSIKAETTAVDSTLTAVLSDFLTPWAMQEINLEAVCHISKLRSSY